MRNGLIRSRCGHPFFRDDGGWNVWCFEEEEGAQKFQAPFGGEFMGLEERPGWAGEEAGRRFELQCLRTAVPLCEKCADGTADRKPRK